MKITDFLTRETVIPALAGGDKSSVLKEMAGLIGEIRAIDDQVVREALLLVFSSLVTGVAGVGRRTPPPR